MGLHHPSKTWFLLSENAPLPDDDVVIANIGKALVPINEIAAEDRSSADEIVPLLEAMFDLCITTGFRHGKLLDLSMSNFGVDADKRVYYLDDEFYRWDDFRSFATLVANIVRSQVRLDVGQWDRLGKSMADCIVNTFQDAHWCQVVAEDIRSKFMPDGRQSSRDRLVASLLGENRKVALKGRQATITVPFSGALTKQKVNIGANGGNGGNSSGVFALLADIHANEPALRAVLDFLDQRQITAAIVLGDIVGYGPHPVECIDLMKARPEFHVLKGNHDHGAAAGFFGRGFSSVARWVLEWTADVIDKESQQWLSQLSLYLDGPDWYAVHGAPVDKTFFNAYVYEMTYRDNLDYLRDHGIKFCFHGHTHMQGTYRLNGDDYLHSTEKMQDVSSAQHWLVCPGAVGQPRDGDGGAQFALFDIDRAELSFHSVPYDVTCTIQAMEHSGFPTSLMNRLRMVQS